MIPAGTPVPAPVSPDGLPRARLSQGSLRMESLVGISIGFALVLAVHFRNLPLWVLITAGTCIGLHLLLALRGGEAPHKSVTLLIAVLSIALLFLKFRTFNGLAAGTALLALTCALKLLETFLNQPHHSRPQFRNVLWRVRVGLPRACDEPPGDVFS